MSQNSKVSSTVQNIPKFNLDQVLWLERAFPEQIKQDATSEELYINLGSRRVVHNVRNLYETAKRNNVGG